MKLIARTFAILAAALVVAGITFAFAQSSYAQSLSPARTLPAEVAQLPAGAASSQAQPARGPGGEHNESASLFGLVEVAKNLAIIGVITAVVAGITRLKRGRKAAPSALA